MDGLREEAVREEAAQEEEVRDEALTLDQLVEEANGQPKRVCKRIRTPTPEYDSSGDEIVPNR